VVYEALDPYFPGQIESAVLAVLSLILLAVKVWALVDSLFHSDKAYVAADKQNKLFWVLLLAIFVLLHYLTIGDPRHILNLIGTVAAFVYLADVRPVLRSMRQY
jgi:quinol-cytochrome oxidoreductase complex cytochrome b subunit